MKKGTMNVIAIVKPTYGFYLIILSVPKSSSKYANDEKNKFSDEWHHDLGHCCPNRLKNLLEMLSYITKLDRDSINNETCILLMVGKGKRSSMSSL